MEMINSFCEIISIINFCLQLSNVLLPVGTLFFRRTRSLYGVNPDSHFGPKACLMMNFEE